VICGTGEEEASLRQLTSELGLGKRVTFSGYRHDVYELMQKSDLLILPSWWEGMPNVLLESLAIGLPCIASDISANRALLDDSCCAFFSPESPVELARVITALLRDPGRLERQTEAGLRVARDHSVDALLEKYAALYRSISPATDDSYVAASRRPQT
jgi:glycosyltransferase involved in cell wall biosynthesis